MPSKPPSVNSHAITDRGTLYVVASPIGNREDITLRALKILNRVDIIAAEDTRHSGRFLSGHGIKTRLISYHEHNEIERTPLLIQKLNQGHSVALLSNAGTPTVSDPGYTLVQSAIDCGIAVIPVPGVSALTTALSVAGLPTDAFVFAGFLARKKKKRLEQLAALAGAKPTVVLYESPRRILSLLAEVLDIMGDRHAVLCREMTKIHEEYLRGKITELLCTLEVRAAVKGECTLLVSGKKESGLLSRAEIEREVQKKMAQKTIGLKEVTRSLAEKYNISRREVYLMALKIKKGRHDHE